MAGYQDPGSQNITGGLNPEPVGGQNSLDQYIRSIQNLTGVKGQETLNQGQGVYQSGVQSMAPSLDYLTKLVKGDSASTDQALAPQIDQIGGQFDAARNIISQQPRGGGKASVLAQAPFDKAKTISNMKSQARGQAAGQLSQAGGAMAGAGLGEEGLGAGLLGQSGGFALTKQGLDYSQPGIMDRILQSAQILLGGVTGIMGAKSGGKE